MHFFKARPERCPAAPHIMYSKPRNKSPALFPVLLCDPDAHTQAGMCVHSKEPRFHCATPVRNEQSRRCRIRHVLQKERWRTQRQSKKRGVNIRWARSPRTHLILTVPGTRGRAVPSKKARESGGIRGRHDT